MNKPYVLASERSAALIGCAYIAPLVTNAWFRWDNSRDSGVYTTGAEVSYRKPTHVQIFDDGEWHPVVAFYGATCKPATDYFSTIFGEDNDETY